MLEGLSRNFERVTGWAVLFVLGAPLVCPQRHSKVWVGGCQFFCQHRREGASILLESFESAQRKSKGFEICPASCECYRFRRPNIARQLLTMFTRAKTASFCCGSPPPLLERCKTGTLRDAPPPLKIPLEDRDADVPFSAVSQLLPAGARRLQYGRRPGCNIHQSNNLRYAHCLPLSSLKPKCPASLPLQSKAAQIRLLNRT